MKLLLFSDLHRNSAAARRLLEMSADADAIIGAGDFATMRRGLPDTIDVLRQAACPAVFVPGNGESVEELADACAGWNEVHVLHGTAAEVGGVTFFGLGGGIPTTPFGPWSYDFTEEEAEAALKRMPTDAVFVTHSPPFECVDVDSSGVSRGSIAIRSAITSRSLPLVVCGHVHDSWEQTAQIGDTTVINAGPRGMWFDLNERKSK